jgi:hypothetical protein
MEKIKSGNKKNATIRVQFEYSNDNDVVNLSREFKINISLDEKTDFEINKRKILKESNFQTQEQRNNYHMFNKSKKKFLTKNSDFISYINTNSPVILINCYEYCDNVIRKLNEETNIFFNKGKSIGSNEIKRKEFINELSCLENNFDVDIFANEFIYKKGVELLLSLIKDYCGEIRLYALKGLDKLLSFESVIEFFNNNEDNMNVLFNTFIGNNEFEIVFPLYDIILQLIGGNQEKIINLTNMCDKYFFQKTIKFFGEENIDNQAKNYILFFINIILNFSNEKRNNELIIEIINAGIFDEFGKINDVEMLSEQIELFKSSVEKIMNEIDKNNPNYKIIKQKYNDYLNNTKFYHIQNLIIKANSDNKEIKSEAIKKLNDILKDKNNGFNLIYEAFLKNYSLDKVNSFYLYFLVLFADKNNITNFINESIKHAEKTKSKPLIFLIKILSDPKSSINLKFDTFSFINKTLSKSLSYDEVFLEFLYIIIDSGIFELLEKTQLEKFDDLKKECLVFYDIIKNNLSKIEQSKEKRYLIIKDKFEQLQEKKVLIQINQLLLKLHNESNESHMISCKQILDLINNEKNFIIFFKTFIDNDMKNLFFSYFKIFSLYCSQKDDNCMRFIKINNEFEQKYKKDGFSHIINYLDEYQNELVQVKALELVNTLICVKDKQIAFQTLYRFEQLGLFENLDQLVKEKEKANNFKAQLSVFFIFANEVISANKKEKYYNTINTKYKKLKDDKEFFESTVNDFVIYD